MIDVKPTVEVCRKIANQMRYYADDIDKIAEGITQDQNLERVPEVMENVVNCISSLRLDLLVRRPIRELGKD